MTNINLAGLTATELVKLIKEATVELSGKAYNEGYEMADSINNLGAVASATELAVSESVEEVKVRNPLIETAQQKRDRIVEEAIKDVKALERRGATAYECGGSIGNRTYKWEYYTVKFNVNHEKRTVVALVYHNNGNLLERGIAKCDPDDCFNVHIGKAIALRRALGLDILEDYTHAPMPTELRVGDIVRIYSFGGGHISTEGRVSSFLEGVHPVINNRGAVLFAPERDGDCVIDDSRVVTE